MQNETLTSVAVLVFQLEVSSGSKKEPKNFKVSILTCCLQCSVAGKHSIHIAIRSCHQLLQLALVAIR